MRSSIVLSAALTTVLLCTSGITPTGQARADAPTYTAVDLGGLPGSTSSVALAINARGQIVGASASPGRDHHAVLWENGTITDLGTLGGNFSVAQGINNAGLIVGYSQTADRETHGFLWEEGVLRDLSTPDQPVIAAIAINARGQIAVVMTDSAGRAGAGIWHRGTVTNLPPPEGATSCQPTGINAAGAVSGGCVGDLFGARGVVWDHTGVTVLDLPGGGADGINASGQVVGIRLGATRPILWDNGIPIDLSTVGAPEGFVPSALNARGQVVGSRYVGSPSGADALLWHNGTTVDLGTAPGEVTQAWDINASGEVVGDSHLLGSGEVRARLWTRKRN